MTHRIVLNFFYSVYQPYPKLGMRLTHEMYMRTVFNFFKKIYSLYDDTKMYALFLQQFNIHIWSIQYMKIYVILPELFYFLSLFLCVHVRLKIVSSISWVITTLYERGSGSRRVSVTIFNTYQIDFYIHIRHRQQPIV